ncbi:MAG: AAA family ATPase, partial [Candidatus Thermoplasmatota archaeon]|nr:AAA family ATPase [Candidatus Thermoplasmatota archaeon]
MKRIVIASMERGAGKTSFVVGFGKSTESKIGYMKPFGERILYRKKRLLDYDSVLISSLFDLNESPEDLSLGFDHSKLRFMYDRESIVKKLREMAERIEKDCDILFIEGGRDLSYGSSLDLDPVTVARTLDAELIFVLSGEQDKIVDEVFFITEYLRGKEVRFKGIIINKVNDPEDLMMVNEEIFRKLEAPILGLIPYMKDLTYFTMEHISNVLFAKIIAGNRGLSSIVKNIFVGAMTGSKAIESPLFKREGKLIITSGDRINIILGALESDTAGIVLTNNQVPPANIISRADEMNIPLLLVQGDTFATAKLVDDMERLL